MRTHFKRTSSTQGLQSPEKRDPFFTGHSFWPLLPRPSSPSLLRAVVILSQRPDAHPGETALFTHDVLLGEKARAPLA